MLIADIFIAFGIGAFWTLAFESPIVALEQILFKTPVNNKKGKVLEC